MHGVDSTMLTNVDIFGSLAHSQRRQRLVNVLHHDYPTMLVEFAPISLRRDTLVVKKRPWFGDLNPLVGLLADQRYVSCSWSTIQHRLYQTNPSKPPGNK